MTMSVLGMAFALVFGTIAFGIYLIRRDRPMKHVTRRRAMAVNLALAIGIVVYFFYIVVPSTVMAEGVQLGAPAGEKGLGLLAMALSTGLATIGTGYAVGAVGSSALGAISEDPKILGKTLIYVGLAEGIAIYGLIISILILGQLK